MEPVRTPLIRAGYVWREHNTERTKRYFREQPGARRTHIHVRRAGSFSEQFALLFRDLHRVHPEHARRYAALKHDLAPHLAVDRRRYTEAKEPFIWDTMRAADRWAHAIGWQPRPSDA
ncbi:MAG: GrpB family protein [Acidimicrobiales bacterium]